MPERTYTEVYFRISLAEKLIEILITDPDVNNDPRAPEAIEYYERQISIMQNELATLEKPKDIVIGLQPGRLITESKSINKE